MGTHDPAITMTVGVTWPAIAIASTAQQSTSRLKGW
jgi:hypothetical protein